MTELPTDAEVPALVAEYAKIRETMPAEILEQLRPTPSTYGITVDKARACFAQAYNHPAVAATYQGVARFEAALRVMRARLNGLLGSATFDFVFQPVSVSGQPIEAKDKPNAKTPSDPKKPKQWSFRANGLARCVDEKSPFEGPASLTIYNYGDEATAARDLARFRPGHVYALRAKLSDKSPKGKMGIGNVGIVQGSAADGFREIPEPNGQAWADPHASFAEVIRPSPIPDLLLKPVQYGTYHIRGRVARGSVFTNKNGESGSLVLSDDALDSNPQLLIANKGGINVFLSRHNIAKARLAQGSEVDMILSGYESDRKDSTGAKTGDKQWTWNEISMKVTLDLGGGTEIPDPNKVAVAAPAATGISRDLAM